MTDRPRNIANDILDAVETATSKWTRQKKSEERHPGMIRYRTSRMTREPRTTQKEAAWEVMEQAYMAASGNNTLPAMARQIYYQARPKIMALTEDKELQYGYFSQTLLPDYIDEHGVDWNVVYDARGHFMEPHTNRQHRLRHDRGRKLSARAEGAGHRRRGVCRRERRYRRSIRKSRRRIVLREGRFQSAVQGGESRQSLRPHDRFDQGRVRHCGEAVDRQHLRRPRPSAIRAA